MLKKIIQLCSAQTLLGVAVVALVMAGVAGSQWMAQGVATPSTLTQFLTQPDVLAAPVNTANLHADALFLLSSQVDDELFSSRRDPFAELEPSDATSHLVFEADSEGGAQIVAPGDS